jgi:hypothetical protein
LYSVQPLLKGADCFAAWTCMPTGRFRPANFRCLVDIVEVSMETSSCCSVEHAGGLLWAVSLSFMLRILLISSSAGSGAISIYPDFKSTHPSCRTVEIVLTIEAAIRTGACREALPLLMSMQSDLTLTAMEKRITRLPQYPA